MYKSYDIKNRKDMNQLNYLGVTIEVKSDEISVWEGNEGKPVVSINRILSSKFIRNFIKLQFPKRTFKYWVQSDSYSGGSSINVYVSEPNGTPIKKDDFETIQSFCNSVVGGSFDGMTDSYNQKPKVEQEDGYSFSFSTSYIFTYNRPPYGTKEYDLNKNL